MSVIVAENIKKSFEVDKTPTIIIDDVSLQIEEGSFSVILGKSGAGKSTLLYVLSGLEKINSGKIYLRDKRIDNLSERKLCNIRRREMGFIFQSYNLVPNLSVYGNISFPLDLQKVKRKEVKNRVEELAEMLQIEKLLKKHPFQLSGGEQQRVAIARALANKPAIIFADEPTGNLDSKNSEIVMNLLKNVNESENTTILMVTHDMDIANKIERKLIISDGRIKVE